GQCLCAQTGSDAARRARLDPLRRYRGDREKRRTPLGQEKVYLSGNHLNRWHRSKREFVSTSVDVPLRFLVVSAQTSDTAAEDSSMVAEIRFGVESIDHIAVPVRDLEINQAFYVDVLGLQFKTTRRNPDGTPRQTYVLAGNNIIGLHLPAVLRGASPGAAPRIGIRATRERLEQTQQNLKAANHPFRGPVEHGDGPLALSIYFDDPEGNHLEFCLRRSEPLGECISHTVFETLNMKKAMTFY